MPHPQETYRDLERDKEQVDSVMKGKRPGAHRKETAMNLSSEMAL